ncbi:MAG: DUF4339 domain-containing protein [Bacteroidota bacterium]|jgi:hypothetical protein|nr:DUF4339 domain-containing protein [Bacteroidota bacterium]
MKYHYSDGSQDYGELTREEIQARVSSRPGGKHLVWQAGWDSWKPAQEVLPIVPVADREGLYHYSDGSNRFGAMTAEEINARIARDPDGKHFVWRDGWPEWRPAHDVFPTIPRPAPAPTPTAGPPSTPTRDATDAPAGTPPSTPERHATPAQPAQAPAGNKGKKGLWIGIGVAAAVVLLLVIIAAISSNNDPANGETAAADDRAGSQEQSNTGANDSYSEESSDGDSSPSVEVSMYVDGEPFLLAGDWGASSILEDDMQKYGTQNLDDNDAKTVWAEGEFGDGRKARLEFTPFESEVGGIYGFRMLNGHCRTRKLWEANARVRRMRVHSGEEERIVELIDTPDWQYVSLGGFAVRGSIEFEILDVYPGSKYEDLTISELNIIWELQSGGF